MCLAWENEISEMKNNHCKWHESGKPDEEDKQLFFFPTTWQLQINFGKSTKQHRVKLFQFI